jgi:hypothetical protein
MCHSICSHRRLNHIWLVALNNFRIGLLESLRLRAITPGTWFIQACDAKFTDEDLSEAGNAFALEYYKAENCYFLDYDEIFPSVPSLYHVEDNWMSFDAVEPTIRARYEAFLNSKQ